MPIAYFRVEGVLVRRSAARCAAWMASRQVGVLGRAGRLAAVGISVPLGLGGDRVAATRVAWRALEGCTTDRLAVLGEDYWKDEALPNLNPAGVALLERCRQQGMRIVLVSDHPHAAIGAARDHLDADELHCNHLDAVGYALSGRLRAPVVTGELDGGWLRRHASGWGHDVATCRAYGHAAGDATLLSGVGLPCAVTPDSALRRLAAQHAWPIVEEAA